MRRKALETNNVAGSHCPVRSRPRDMGELTPAHAVVSYAACVAGAGILANFAALAGLIRKFRKGLFSILLQLAVADIITLAGPAVLELWYRNEQTWTFGKQACMAYGGLQVLTSTASVYLTIIIVLHTFATITLEEISCNRVKRSDDDEIRSSRHSLVNSDSSTPRTLTIDYKMVNARVPVLIPSVIVWTLAVSLSIPAFQLANTTRLGNNTETCTYLEPSHRVIMYSMLSLFNLFIPTAILCAFSVLIIIKLKSKWLLSGLDDLKPGLKLSLWLIVTYLVLCLPRCLLDSFIIYSSPEVLKEPVPKLGLATTCIYMLASLCRPLLSISLLLTLRRISSSRDKTRDV